ncbi:MAG: hypothetical protein F8N39_00960 [Clostridiaceae bacterium]|nr:hypothetical protein [Clostridiaceae bacterium]
MHFESITTAAGKDDQPFSPFVTIHLESHQLRTPGEIDAYIGRLMEELTELGARAKRDLAAAVANDPHRKA